MEGKKWEGPIVITLDDQGEMVIDGIHRGIAYIRCIRSGMKVEELPPLKLQRAWIAAVPFTTTLHDYKPT